MEFLSQTPPFINSFILSLSTALFPLSMTEFSFKSFWRRREKFPQEVSSSENRKRSKVSVRNEKPHMQPWENNSDRIDLEGSLTCGVYLWVLLGAGAPCRDRNTLSWSRFNYIFSFVISEILVFIQHVNFICYGIEQLYCEARRVFGPQPY